MKIFLPARLTLLGLILAFCAPLATASAGEFSAVINGKSYHLGADENFNENNYGLGVEYEFASQSRWKKKLMANGFVDSNNDMSYMVGGGLHRKLFATDRFRGLYVDAGVNAFLMTRKDVNDNAPFPGILPSLTIGNRHLGLNLTYLPKAAVEKLLNASMTDDGIDGIVFLQMKFAINSTR